MKKTTLFGAAVLMIVLGFTAPSQAKEPGLENLAGKQSVENNRGRHYGRGRGGRGGGGIWFSVGSGGGYHRPRHYYPRQRYHYAPPPVYYYAPPPTTYYYPAPGCGGTVIVR